MGHANKAGIRRPVFAGQINYTLGYEERDDTRYSVAGLNAAAYAARRPVILFDRAKLISAL